MCNVVSDVNLVRSLKRFLRLQLLPSVLALLTYFRFGQSWPCLITNVFKVIPSAFCHEYPYATTAETFQVLTYRIKEV